MKKKTTRAFRTISEAGEELDLQPHVLRFWESKFSHIKPIKRGGGRRFYRPEDIEFLRGIKILLHDEKHPIKDVQKLIRVKGPQRVVELGQSIEKAALDKDISDTVLIPKRIANAKAPQKNEPERSRAHTSSVDISDKTRPVPNHPTSNHPASNQPVFNKGVAHTQSKKSFFRPIEDNETEDVFIPNPQDDIIAAHATTFGVNAHDIALSSPPVHADTSNSGVNVENHTTNKEVEAKTHPAPSISNEIAEDLNSALDRLTALRSQWIAFKADA